MLNLYGHRQIRSTQQGQMTSSGLRGASRTKDLPVRAPEPFVQIDQRLPDIAAFVVVVDLLDHDADVVAPS